MAVLLYTIYLLLLSSIAYAAYASDKRKAKKGKRRISEATLLGLSFFGGALGGYVAMLRVRHKTKHWYFHAVNLLGLLWQTSVWVILFAHLTIGMVAL